MGLRIAPSARHQRRHEDWPERDFGVDRLPDVSNDAFTSHGSQEEPWLHETIITHDLHGGRFEPPSPAVCFRYAKVCHVDFSGLAFSRLCAESSIFEDCSFDNISLEYAPLGLPPSNLFRACTFDGADLRGIEPGHARFERCTFVKTRIEDWFAFCAEFVDCRFATTIETCKFSTRRINCADGLISSLRRKSNEFRGNDFSDSVLIDTSFVGIDLDQQAFPDTSEYIKLDRLEERFTHVRSQVLEWPDEETRKHALVMLEVYYFDADKRVKREKLFARRDDLPIRPDVRERVWEMLERAVS